MISTRVSPVLCVVLLLAISSAQAQTALAGFTPGAFRVTESGAADYRIAIKVPPGIAGMEPRLALVYSSQAGNGLLGVGGSLDGLSAIARCRRTKLQDGSPGGIDYQMSDRFCLDGQRLVLVSGSYGSDGAEYRTERETFSKIISYGVAGNGPAWFKVWSKAGQVTEYGNTGDSKIEAQGKPTVRVWALNKISDTKGNYLSFTYDEDGANGGYSVSRIDYTGNAAAGVVANRSVRFTYQARPDVITLRSRGSLIRTPIRLASVKTYIGEIVVKEYRIAYTQGAGTLRSRLASVTECSGDGTGCLPATTLAWLDNSAAFSGGHSAQPGTDWVSWPSARPITGDFNGDGKIDLAISANSLSGIATYLSNGNGTFAPVFSPQTGTDWVSWPSAKPLPGDFNGDGLTDIAVCMESGGGIATYLSNGNGTFTAVFSSQTGTDWCSWPSIRLVTGDFNGDGLADIAVMQDSLGGISVYLSNGNGTFTGSYSGQTGTDWASWPSAKPMAGDFNGDGLTDIAVCMQNGGGIGVYLSNGNGTFAATYSSQTGSDWCSWPTARPIAGDFNGDGLTDIAVSADSLGGLGVYIAAGDGTFVPTFSSQTGSDWTSWPSARPLSGDFNGDGLTDIAVVGVNMGGIALYLANGDGSFRGGWYGQTDSDWASWSTARVMTADFLGNGKSGILVSANDLGGIASYGGYSPLPDFVTSIDNGLAPAGISYQSATSATVYTKTSGASFPVVEIQAPMYLVSSATQSNGIGGTIATTHRYIGARSHAHAGFLGFGKVEVTEAQGIKATTTFRQDYPYLGLPTQLLKVQPGGSVISQVDNTWADALLPFVTGSGGKYHKSELSQAVERSYELSGALVTTTTTTTSYDSYGNPTSVTASTGDGYNKATTNIYANDVPSWLLGRLTRSTVTSTSP
jgi:hypothetical protein